MKNYLSLAFPFLFLIIFSNSYSQTWTGSTNSGLSSRLGNTAIGLNNPPNDTRLYVKSNIKVGIVSHVDHYFDFQYGIISAINRSNTKAFAVINTANSYKESFKNNNADNSQGSAVSNLVNALSSHYETYIRKGKVGLPSGVFNGFSQQPMPGHVEALYSGYSFDFSVAVMQAMNKYIKGNHFTTNAAGQGLDDYIIFVAAKDANGNGLETTIDSQITSIISALNGHSNVLSNEVMNNNTQVLATYQEMQKLVPMIKVDLTSALGVLVTYQDNDGD